MADRSTATGGAEQDVTGDRTALRHNPADAAAHDSLARPLAKVDARRPEHARQVFHYWRNDPDLAGVRDPAALAQLGAESAAWQQLWAEVARRAGQAAPKWRPGPPVR